MTLQGFTYSAVSSDLCRETLPGDILTLRVCPSSNTPIRLQHLTAVALIEQPKGSDLQCTIADGIGTLGRFTVPGVVRFTFEHLGTTSTAYVITFPTDAIRHPYICPGRPIERIRNTLRAITREVILPNARRIFSRGEPWNTGDLIVHSDPQHIPEFINLQPYIGN